MILKYIGITILIIVFWIFITIFGLMMGAG